MSRRIDVELTSRREDGSWTWRAAGAKAPKGIVESSLLPADVQVGNVLRVEIETYIDGIAILAVLPPKSGRAEPQRLELLGPRSPERLVTTTLAPRGRGDRDRPRRPRDAEGGPRREGGERREGGRREGGGRREPREGAPRETRSDAGERRPRPEAERRPPAEQKPKPKRLRPGRTHRRELIAGLPEEQRPVAEELSRGGIAGVRAALDAQNAQAKSEGRPEINPAPLLTLAEELWPRMRSAEWLDRAEAAVKEVDELDLRDLRSVVVAADSAARDDDTRALAAQLREALTRRVDEEHLKWLTELAELVAENRVVAALRRSSRPPKAGAPLPSDLARLLIDRTSEGLNAEVGADRWAVLLDALSFSPVRSSVSPAAVPESPNEELLAAVRKSAARLPHIAALFGIESPPVPAAPARGGRRGGPARSGGRSERGGAPIPPPPPRPDAGAAAPATVSDEAAPAAEVSAVAEHAEPAATEQTTTEQTPAEQTTTEPATATEHAEPAATEPTTTEQTTTEQTPAEQTTTEPATATEHVEPAATDQTTTEQTTTGQTSAEQTSAEQTSAEQAEPAPAEQARAPEPSASEPAPAESPPAAVETPESEATATEAAEVPEAMPQDQVPASPSGNGAANPADEHPAQEAAPVNEPGGSERR